MRIVIQRCREASVSIEGKLHRQIGEGMLILVGIEDRDGIEDVVYLSKKIATLRIFPDERGVMNRSILETGGDILLVSQFTLMASTKKGNRPSYIRASRPEVAIPLYEALGKELEIALGKSIERGIFGADMQVSLTNDGPVTIIIDSHDRVF
ncbi:MAG: D-aminoacyl-tRNA deacylase [Porphyromonadaceae bacterium]|nr:D-aminoacyl-tRNA deacylase [Porphyromonadaceae bacterium]